MATVYNDSAVTTGFHPVQGLGTWVSRRFAAWQASHRRAREIRDLALFTDRDLWDVGLSRSDLMSLEKGTYSRD